MNIFILFGLLCYQLLEPITRYDLISAGMDERNLPLEKECDPHSLFAKHSLLKHLQKPTTSLAEKTRLSKAYLNEIDQTKFIFKYKLNWDSGDY
jgi:hypothetical protein